MQINPESPPSGTSAQPESARLTRLSFFLQDLNAQSARNEFRQGSGKTNGPPFHGRSRQRISMPTGGALSVNPGPAWMPHKKDGCRPEPLNAK
jgi:hypothetical protein